VAVIDYGKHLISITREMEHGYFTIHCSCGWVSHSGPRLEPVATDYDIHWMDEVLRVVKNEMELKD
jgi:hypothetical protein